MAFCNQAVPVSGERAMTAFRMVVLGMGILALAGCSNMTTTQQRALSGGAIGAAAGAGIAAIAGGPVLLGGLLGGAGGAVVGAVTH
jgi:osmotically inducible lipoprotein OsmB